MRRGRFSTSSNNPDNLCALAAARRQASFVAFDPASLDRNPGFHLLTSSFTYRPFRLVQHQYKRVARGPGQPLGHPANLLTPNRQQHIGCWDLQAVAALLILLPAGCDVTGFLEDLLVASDSMCSAFVHPLRLALTMCR
ncbi:hypothetical protein EJ03DRAFT_184655 [Teratosphaeria nubilosa]|uniref:Uncharacterized protein n=1 Tax=Teratosphaeria nubilosa TaxID=161662 RepID=A0A6G1L1R3_9PEZI|nr:hypothetical protein EJ03DRAFT_184655 [Teratosphaeria nubilosa]